MSCHLKMASNQRLVVAIVVLVCSPCYFCAAQELETEVATSVGASTWGYPYWSKFFASKVGFFWVGQDK